MPDPLIERLRAARPQVGDVGAGSDLGPRDRQLLERIVSVPVSARPPRRNHVLIVAGAALLMALAAMAASTVTSLVDPPREPTRLSEAARDLGVERSMFGGIVLGDDAQLRVEGPAGTWEAAVTRDGGDTLWVKPPSHLGADGVDCPVPDGAPAIWACLRSRDAHPFLAGRASPVVARIQVIESSGAAGAEVPLSEGVYLLPDPPVPSHLRALDAAGEVVQELLIDTR